MANIAPKTPQSLPPINKATNTKAGGSPMTFFVSMGVKMLPSICCIKTRIIIIKRAFTQLSRAQNKIITTPEKTGPIIGIISEIPTSKPKETAYLTFRM